MNNIFICLDNIRSLYNVGAVFRTAEFMGISKIILLGYSGTISKDGVKQIHPKVSKTSLGTENILNVSFMDTENDLLVFAKINNLKIVAIEQSPNAASFKDWVPQNNSIVVFGNEKTGVDKTILDNADTIVEIQRSGTHQSLNIEVTAGIVMNKISETNPS